MTQPATQHGASVGLDRWVRAHPVVPDAVLAAVIAVLTVTSSIPLVWDSQVARWVQIVLIVAIVLGYAAVAVRRIAPEIAYVIGVLEMGLLLLTPDLTGAAAVQFGLPVPAIVLPSSLVYLVLLYSVTAYGRGRTPLYALLLGLVGAVVTSTRLWAPDLWANQGLNFGGTWKVLVPIALLSAVLTPWSLGRFRRVRTAYVGELEARARREEHDRVERAERAAATERNRIAREMHDVVAHSLSVMVAQAEGARLLVRRDPNRATPVLQTIATTGREALGEMRGLLGVLHQDDGPAQRSPQPTLDQLPDLVARVHDAGLPVTLRHTGVPTTLNQTAQLAVYRLVQESLTNVVKHASKNATAEVLLAWSVTDLVVTISDRSPGDSRHGGEGSAGYGLAGMRERILQVGGTLTAGPVAGGFVVQARLPRSTDPGQR